MKQDKINSLAVVKDVQAYLKSSCPELTKFEFPVFGSIAIGLIRINARGGKAELVCDELADKRYINAWYKDVGAIIINDIKKGSFSDYYEFHMGSMVGLLRRVTDDIADLINECGLGVVKHGDFSYVFIRFRPEDGTYAIESRKFGYVPEKLESEMDEVEECEDEADNEDECKCIELF